jgi:hypothetical protein
MSFPKPRETLTLYHGTIRRDAEQMIKGGIDITLCDANADFGAGFYTTSWIKQARKRAKQRASMETILPSEPAVLSVEIAIAELRSMQTRAFAGLCWDDANGYWEFVRWHRWMGRRNSSFRPNDPFDIVIGPVAVEGYDRAVQLKECKVLRFGDQISFHTPDALALINGRLSLVP